VTYECKASFSLEAAQVASSWQIVWRREYIYAHIYACATSTRSLFLGGRKKFMERPGRNIADSPLGAVWFEFWDQLFVNVSLCVCMCASRSEQRAREILFILQRAFASAGGFIGDAMSEKIKTRGPAHQKL